MSPSVSPLHRVPDFTHGSVLLSLWFQVVLIGAAVAFVVVFVAMWLPSVRTRFRLTGRRRWPVALGSAVLALALATASVADAINRHFSYIPSFAALGGHYSPDLIGSSNVSQLMRIAESGGGLPAHGIVVHVMLSGPRSGISRRGYVYLPRSYFDPAQRNRRFPVLYMLHGSPGIAADWLRGGFIDRAMDYLLAHAIIAPFIVVLPDFNGGYTRDTECQDIVRGPQVQTYLTDDVTGWIDHHFRTIATPAGRAIGGMSTGGYCALNLMLRHQDVFSAAVMHSGSLAPIESSYSGSLWGGSDALRRANTPRDYIPTVPVQRPLAVYCDAGTSDPSSVQTCVDTRRLLAARRVPVDVHIYAHQGHDYSAWRKDLYASLPWVSRWFTQQRQAPRRRRRPYHLAATHAPRPVKLRA
jgi:enterochelin esterase-like enzyme